MKNIICAVLILTCWAVYAAPPATMSYQGFLTDSSDAPVSGTVNFNFYIYDVPTGGTALWSEDHDNVTVTNGVFNVVLGASPDPAADPLVDFNPSTGYQLVQMRDQLYLEIEVEGEAQPMSPRHKLSAVPYALAARKVVYQQNLTVSPDGGDAPTVSQAIDLLLGQGDFSTPLSPVPGSSTRWVIQVEAGVYTEPGTTGDGGTLVLPDYVTIRGAGTQAVTLQAAGIEMSGTGSALENVTIDGQTDSVTVVNAAGSSMACIRNCFIISTAPTALIDLSSAAYGRITGNTLVGNGPSSCGGILMAGTSHTQIINNHIDLQYEAGIPSSGIGSFCITDAGSATNQCVISRNSLRYATSGVSGIGPSYGIGLSGTASTMISSRVSFNTFMRGAKNKDIVGVTTGNPPMWTAPGTGAHGICNQASDGSQISSF